MFQINIPKNLNINLLEVSFDKGSWVLCNEMQNIQKQINDIYSMWKSLRK